MVPYSTLIVQPSVTLQSLVGACSQALDHNVAEAVDSSIRTLSDTEKFLSILSSIRAPGSPTGLPFDLLPHVKFSILSIADERDMLDIFSICSGMDTMFGETKATGILIAVISGNLNQWRNSVLQGMKSPLPEIQECFQKIHSLFVEVGLGSIWKDVKEKMIFNG